MENISFHRAYTKKGFGFEIKFTQKFWEKHRFMERLLTRLGQKDVPYTTKIRCALEKK